MANSLDEIVDFKQFVFKLARNWFFLLLSLLLAFTVAYAYNRYSTELFNVETSILIKEDNSLSSASDLIYERVSSSSKILENKELMIKSYPLIYKTLEDLAFDITYYIEGNVKVTETFESPIILKCKNAQFLKGKKIKISIIDENSFALIDLFTQKEQIRKFNEKFLFYDVEVSVENNINFSADSELEIPITIVQFYSLQSLSQIYQQRLVVFQEDRESTVINISILTADERKGVVFLNRLIYNYINDEIAEKNLASINTVNFINNQLAEMSDSLALIEQQIQHYKNNNNVTDLSLKAQSIYTNIVGLETELAKTKTMNNYFDYLFSYLVKGENLEGVSVPTSFGVNDVSLNSLISQLVEVQIKKNVLNKKFLGITEYIAHQFSSKKNAMLIYNKKLAVCPITTHLPLKLVTKRITKSL